MPQFARYVLSAGLASIADLAVAQALLFLPLFQAGLLFGTPVVAGALAGMSVNFALSRKFVFAHDERDAHQQMLTFFVISLTTLALKLIVAFALLNLFLLAALPLADLLPIPAVESRLAQFGAMGMVAIYSFFAHKHISFGGGFRALARGRSAA